MELESQLKICYALTFFDETNRFSSSALPSPLATASSLKSLLHPTSITGISGPHIDLTSSIHFDNTLSKLSGVSIENAMRMICDFE